MGSVEIISLSKRGAKNNMNYQGCIIYHERPRRDWGKGKVKAELKMKIKCAEEIKKQLAVQRKRYPLMTEEDVVKFVFQGMLGPEHMVPSLAAAQARLQDEMKSLFPDDSEPLTEQISSDWIRLNLRPAIAQGMGTHNIARYFACSAKTGLPKFTRQNVYNFCVEFDGSEKMRAAAEKVLDGNWLPQHSEQYRNAYHPAYRVLHRNFRKFDVEGDDE